MDREEFTKKIRREVEPIDMKKYQRQQKEEQLKQKEKRYTAQKGTATRAKKRKRKMKIKLAALIMAAAVGVGGISLANKKMNEADTITITQMQEDGINPQSIGLSSETIALFKQYDEYFENFETGNISDLTDNDIISMISDIEGLHFSVVKEKMGSLIGEDSKNIKIHYGIEKADGQKYTTVVANEDTNNKEVYSDTSGALFGIGRKNHIPDELTDVIWQLESLEKLETKLREDKITKVNAVKELQELYEDLEQVATGKFTQDEKGNISITHYEQNDRQQENKEDER